MYGLGKPVFTQGMGSIGIDDATYEGMTAAQKSDLSAWFTSLKKNNRNLLENMTRVKGSIASLKMLPGVTEQRDSALQARQKLYDEGLDHAKRRMWEVMKSSSRMKKAGVFSSIGFNFYDLRGPVELLYPFYTPFRNFTPRPPRVNAGVGTAAHWQQITNPGYAYPGVPEAQRAQITTPNMVPRVATYKEFGKENEVTYTAEFAGEGFNDNLATERLDGLLGLFLAEEAQILNGNSGVGSGFNGFQLGTPVAPTMTASAAASSLATGTKITVWVVALTAMANPQNAQYGYFNAGLTVAGGLTPTFTYAAPGSAQNITINGGTSALGAESASYTTTSPDPSVVASIPPIKGAMGGYAWYVSVNATPTTSNAFLYAITQYPSVTISAAPTGTQTAAAFVTAGGGVDYSANPYDMDGLFAWAVQYGQWVDLQGASLTSLGNGKVLEVENMLQSIFQLYQTGVDEIWGDMIAVECLDNAVRYGGTSATGFQFIANRDGQGNLLGGFLVSGYLNRFAVANPLGAGVLPIRIHPMIPPGTLLFNIRTVPPGYSHSRLPYIYGMLVQRDYYGIEWPPFIRAWNFGTYVHEVLAHKFPGLLGVITGIGVFVAP
jgi:hypothetical protein